MGPLSEPRRCTLSLACFLTGTLLIGLNVAHDWVVEVLRDVPATSYAKPVIRGDLDRAAASEQVVPAPDGCHLNAALVDLGELARPNPSARRTATSEDRPHDGAKPVAAGSPSAAGALLAEKLLHPILRDALGDHGRDVVEHGLEGILDRFGPGHNVRDEAAELGAHAVKKAGILHFFLNDPIQFPDRVAILGHCLGLHATKLDRRCTLRVGHPHQLQLKLKVGDNLLTVLQALLNTAGFFLRQAVGRFVSLSSLD